MGLYNLKTDPTQQKNLMDTTRMEQQKLDQKLKAILQQYTNRMINNDLKLNK